LGLGNKSEVKQALPDRSGGMMAVDSRPAAGFYIFEHATVGASILLAVFSSWHETSEQVDFHKFL
jgi:hypothetical protein